MPPIIPSMLFSCRGRCVRIDSSYGSVYILDLATARINDNPTAELLRRNAIA